MRINAKRENATVPAKCQETLCSFFSFFLDASTGAAAGRFLLGLHLALGMVFLVGAAFSLGFALLFALPFALGLVAARLQLAFALALALAPSLLASDTFTSEGSGLSTG